MPFGLPFALAWFGCGPEPAGRMVPYPTTEVDWNPAPEALCGIDAPVASVVLGPWPESSIGTVSTAGDLDGDGRAELIVGLYDDDGPAGIRAHRGTPEGVEAEPWFQASAVAPGAELGRAVAVLGDTDGDGSVDLAIAAEAGAVELWTDLTGDPQRAVLDGGPAVAGIDANGDGLGDLLVGGGNDQIALYLGHPGGLPATPDQIVSGDPGFGGELGPAGDIDGNGHQDAVTLDRRGDLWVLPGGGLDGPPYPVARPGGTVGLPVPADLDGDGFGDLVVGWRHQDGRGAVGWWRGSSAGLEPDWAVRIVGETETSQLWEARSLGDLDGDGDDELLLGARGTMVDGAEYAGQIAVHPGGPDGPDPTPSFVATAAGARCFFGERLVAADFDGDGLTDVAARIAVDTERGADADAVVVLLGQRGWVP